MASISQLIKEIAGVKSTLNKLISESKRLNELSEATTVNDNDFLHIVNTIGSFKVKAEKIKEYSGELEKITFDDLSPSLVVTRSEDIDANGNSRTIATSEAILGMVNQLIADVISSSPGALDTLNELAAALGDDPNFATTITELIASKLSKSENLDDLTSKVEALINLGIQASAAELNFAKGVTSPIQNQINQLNSKVDKEFRIIRSTFTGNKIKRNFTLDNEIDSKENLQIFIGGVYQNKSGYSVNNKTIAFDDAPPVATIEVTHFIGANDGIDIDTFTGDESKTSFTLTSLSSVNSLFVYVVNPSEIRFLN